MAGKKEKKERIRTLKRGFFLAGKAGLMREFIIEINMVWKGRDGGGVVGLTWEKRVRTRVKESPAKRRNVSAKMFCVSVCVRMRA